jgi:hypothetical protein
MSEQKIEEITNILKDEIKLSSRTEIDKTKFLPKQPTEEELAKKRRDPEKSGANLIQIVKGDITANTLTPREQEKEGKAVIKAT